MRLLFGPLYVGVNNAPDRYGAHSAYLGPLRALDGLTFGGPGADLPFDPALEPLSALLGRCPPGWRPDALVWWAPEYTPLPAGLEDCPLPSVAALGDWNVNFWGTLPVLGAFDLVLTDRAGVDVLAAHGVAHAGHWRMFSFDPGLHRGDPGAPRDIDVFFAGTLEGTIYEERCRWVHRLAALAPRRRVLIASNVRGEEYAALLRRARIVFNHALRREMNMRAYEAAAAGALLFQERDSLEIGEVLEDGVHCVLYGEDDLESRLAHYLDHEAERVALARAGHARIQQETAAHHVARLVAHVGALRAPGPCTRPWAALPPAEREWRRAIKTLLSCGFSGWPAAADALARLERAGGDGRVAGTLASLLGTAAREYADPRERARLLAMARRHADRALELEPADPLHHLRAAELTALEGDAAGAARGFATAAALARTAQGRLDSVPMPCAMDAVRVALDHAAVAGPEAFDRRARQVVRARALHRLADVCHATGRDDEGLAALRESIQAFPHFADNTLALAQRLAAAGGGLQEAVARALGFVRRYPFNFAARELLADLHLQQGQADAGREVLEEAMRLLGLLHVRDEPAPAASRPAR